MGHVGIQLTEEESKVSQKVKQMGVASQPISQKRNSDKGDYAIKKRHDIREEDDCSYVSLSDGDTNEQVAD